MNLNYQDLIDIILLLPIILSIAFIIFEATYELLTGEWEMSKKHKLPRYDTRQQAKEAVEKEIKEQLLKTHAAIYGEEAVARIRRQARREAIEECARIAEQTKGGLDVTATCKDCGEIQTKHIDFLMTGAAIAIRALKEKE